MLQCQARDILHKILISSWMFEKLCLKNNFNNLADSPTETDESQVHPRLPDVAQQGSHRHPRTRCHTQSAALI